MKKLLQIIGTVIFFSLVLYSAFFFLWVFMMVGCFENADMNGRDWRGCGENLMTDMAVTLYGPVFNSFEHGKK